MVGAFSLLGSPLVDLDTVNSASMSLKNGGDVFRGKSRAKKQSGQVRSLELRRSFVDSGKELFGVVIRRSSRKQRSPLIVSELGGQYEDTFQDIKTQILNYFTYKAVRTVLYQLYEMNPSQYTWLYNFLVVNKPSGDGKVFIRNLAKESQPLAERVMVTRLHLYGKWIKKCNHTEIYQRISDQNLELMRERLLETVIWPSDDTNTNLDTIG